MGAVVFHVHFYFYGGKCTRIVQSAQAPRSASDFIWPEVFSTRFSTELLKTFTLHSHLVLFFAGHWCGNCIAIFWAVRRGIFNFFSADFIFARTTAAAPEFVSLARVMIRFCDA
jgi:hypothetical protein